MPDATMADLVKQHLKGSLSEDVWKEVVQGFCKTKVLPATILTMPWYSQRLTRFTASSMGVSCTISSQAAAATAADHAVQFFQLLPATHPPDCYTLALLIVTLWHS